MKRIRDHITGWKRDLAQVRVKGSFARNALYTFTDAAVNILSQVLLTPIVAHLYGPAAYGIYGLFTSIASNLSMLGSLGYPNAFVLIDDDRRFHALARLSLLLLAGLCVLCMPLFLVPSLLYRLFPSWSVMGAWCMAVPWMVFLLGFWNILINWTNRVKAFNLNARVGPVTNVSLRLVNILTGLLRGGNAHGLILGEVAVRSVTSTWFAFSLRRHGIRHLFRKAPREEMRTVAADLRDYPRYIMPAGWLSLFATQLPIFGLTELGDSSVVGHFTLAGSLLLMPLRLFGFSLTSVFLRKATEVAPHDPRALGDITLRLYKRLLTLGLLPFLGLTFFGDVVFATVLGPDWRIAGAYCGVMGPFYLFRLLSEPLVSVYNALRAERSRFRIYGVQFLICLAATAAGTWIFADATMVVLLFALGNAIFYLIMGCDILRRTGVAWQRTTLRTVALIAATAALLALVRYLLMGQWTAPMHG